MRITTLASVVIPCLGFSASSIAAAEDVMIVSASGYEKKLTNAAASVSGLARGIAVQPVPRSGGGSEISRGCGC